MTLQPNACQSNDDLPTLDIDTSKGGRAATASAGGALADALPHHAISGPLPTAFKRWDQRHSSRCLKDSAELEQEAAPEDGLDAEPDGLNLERLRRALMVVAAHDDLRGDALGSDSR
eukprot:scaffold20306_cov26-Tisochrysis_lutea.AAC.1